MENINLEKGLHDYGQELVANLVKELIQADKKSTGDLIKSIDYELIEKANQYIVNIKSLDYLKYVDEGRRAGSKQPPISAIIPWVKRKGIRIGKTPEQTAFVIARSIAKKGIKPTNVISKAIEKTNKNIAKLISKHAVEDIMEYIDDTLK